ncbi:hypothetical protein JTB14_032637 [Gonioctena quinquepunctata]|nr:hypothetical protein JTB14_032637 [Gonioctena quinquepunctata]
MRDKYLQNVEGKNEGKGKTYPCRTSHVSPGIRCLFLEMNGIDKEFIGRYLPSFLVDHVHKLSTHGTDIIKSSPLPIGQLTDDVIEAGHGDFGKLRQFHSRKTSRINTNNDVFN